MSPTSATYGIVFALAPDDRALFIKAGNDLPNTNGDNSWLLPAPATFVIAADGIIRHARIDADYTSRIEPDEIIDALRRLPRVPKQTGYISVITIVDRTQSTSERQPYSSRSTPSKCGRDSAGICFPSARSFNARSPVDEP